MNVDEIRAILDLVREHELSEFELEFEGLKLKVRKPGTAQAIPVPPLMPASPLPSVSVPAAPGHAAHLVTSPRPAGPVPEADADLSIVKSPIVGTFYRSPEPGAPPFVETGAQVKKGQVLCIIEAMKLMNEIESDYAGEVVAVYVDNGQPVQYGERLFAIRVK
ncbi:MAG: acetyl-CoA carboxylase biotin carboxyl carrier protein [Acidobacteriota bacterium]